MRGRFVVASAAALTMLSLATATGASAATEFGDNCVGDQTSGSGTPLTLFQLSTPVGDTLPLTAPVAGVITKWKVGLIPAAVTIPETLKVVRLDTAGKKALIVGEATGNVTGGANVFETRIPVQAGDRLATFGSSEFGAIYCKVAEATTYGGFEGPGGGPGAVVSYGEVPAAEARFPVSAVIEPDVDGDGFGDETQDKCPQSATTQAACPTVKLSSSLVVKKQLMSVLVTADSQATVTVKGTVKLGKGKTVKLNGGTQIVAPGALARFTVLFPKSVKARLKELSSEQTLSLKLSVSAPNLVGPASSKVFKKKLTGQAKPRAQA